MPPGKVLVPDFSLSPYLIIWGITFLFSAISILSWQAGRSEWPYGDVPSVRLSPSMPCPPPPSLGYRNLPRAPLTNRAETRVHTVTPDDFPAPRRPIVPTNPATKFLSAMMKNRRLSRARQRWSPMGICFSIHAP